MVRLLVDTDYDTVEGDRGVVARCAADHHLDVGAEQSSRAGRVDLHPGQHRQRPLRQLPAALRRRRSCALGMPVAIRFDHEMNGNWYPWSAGLPANQGAAGQPNLYVQAWRHIWNLFNSVGANSDVIWLWAPIRVDTIQPGCDDRRLDVRDHAWPRTTRATSTSTGSGMSAYDYKPTEALTYANTFSQTLDRSARADRQADLHRRDRRRPGGGHAST